MQVGDTGREVSSVLLTTDITEDVVNEAVLRGCQLIVSHHPLLFHGLKQVCGQTPQARVVEIAIKNNIAIYSAHTSLDVAIGGINTRLAEKIGLEGIRGLVDSGLGAIGKLPKPMNYSDFIEYIRDILACTYVRYTRPKKEICKAFRHKPFRGFAFSFLSSLAFHGLMWLAIKNSGMEMPVMQQRFS